MGQLDSSCGLYQLPGAECLEFNRLTWQLEPEQAVLLIHDMQNYYMRPLLRHNPETAKAIIANIATVKQICQQIGIPVVYTEQRPLTVAQRGLLYDLWGPGMQGVDDEAAVVSDLCPVSGYTIVKHKYSAFYNSTFAELLANLSRNQIIITGVYSHIGCMTTALDALMRDLKVFYVADAVGDFSLDFHLSSLKTIGNCCGQLCLTADLVAQAKS
ncbi:MAG: isochorismatase family protein [Cyanobacteria bacterium]|nr:isochorismatase family protein [Cyanobacteriota bacterium]MDW8203257.1 isochorismatase family protein [Cyanobacteriota bacterium SKYGB_h_bin112]